MLHMKPIMSNLESFYKVLIAYLIEQQYRRSEEAQEKMRASLEYVLLDGFSVTEVLKVHKSPAEHVLQNEPMIFKQTGILLVDDRHCGSRK
uniref:LisH domain-containing protein n=1 Tax=Loa loa TaxID=7209 RepID=A0A1I7VDH6_LOALO